LQAVAETFGVDESQVLRDHLICGRECAEHGQPQ
jgi:hypothetical protein